MNVATLSQPEPRGPSLFAQRAPASLASSPGPSHAPAQPPEAHRVPAAAPPPADLPELCEPTFRYICQLSRAGAAGTYDFVAVRREIVGRLQAARAAAAAEPGTLAAQYDLIEPVLVYFVDFTIATGPLPFAREWGEHRLAYELRPPCMTGDTEFFHQLDRTIADPSDLAVDRLAIFYTCLGLGFTGMYHGRPEAAPLLRRRMHECAARLRDRIDPAESPICPDAYLADDRPPRILPARLACTLAVSSTCLVVALYIACLLSYRQHLSAVGAAARDAQIKLRSDAPAVSPPAAVRPPSPADPQGPPSR